MEPRASLGSQNPKHILKTVLSIVKGARQAPSQIERFYHWFS